MHVSFILPHPSTHTAFEIIQNNMMNTMNLQNKNKNDESQSVSLSDVSSFNDSEIDCDLKGIPRSILDLMQVQPTLNLMTCGDVSHGKSTLLAALSGEKTGKHSKEKKGNMTIRLGYTSCKIYKCSQCPRPDCYFSTHSDLKPPTRCPNKCGLTTPPLLIRHLSFVDVPGHSQLMQTMVSATSIADGAILVIDSSKPVPGKQTAQHLEAMNLLGLMQQNKMIVAQNKIDLISPSKACRNYEDIRGYLRTFGDEQFAFNTPIIPISAQSKLNIDALCNLIITHFPKYSPSLISANCSLKSSDLLMNIIRSFDVNRPRDLVDAAAIDSICGGVIGGAVLNGHIAIDQVIEIRPGYLMKRKEKNKAMKRCKFGNQWEAQPIRTIVRSLKYGKNAASKGYSGGNVGIETTIDPSLTKADRMCGHVVIDANHPNPPPIFNKFIMSYALLSGQESDFKKFEMIRVNVGSFKMRAEVIGSIKEYDGALLLVLEAPICARVGDKIGICRQSKKREWAFIGGGIIRKTKNIRIQSDDDKIGKRMKKSVNVSSTADALSDQNKEIVHLRYQQRSGKKGITTIIGLPKEIKLKKLMFRMKKEFNSGATLVDDEEDGNGQIIQIQGDLRNDIAQMLEKLNVVTKAQIVVHGF